MQFGIDSPAKCDWLLQQITSYTTGEPYYPEYVYFLLDKAIEFDHMPVIQQLVEVHKINLRQKTCWSCQNRCCSHNKHERYSILDVAIQFRRQAIALYLIEHSASVQYIEVLCSIISLNWRDVADAFIARMNYVTPAWNCDTCPLYTAIAHCNASAVEKLLQLGFRTDTRHVEMAVTQRENYPEFEAVAVIRHIMTLDPEAKKDVPLARACSYGVYGIVEYLVSCCDVNQANTGQRHVGFRGDPGRTPLQMAASAGHVEIVKLLLAHGANPDAWSSCYYTHGGNVLENLNEQIKCLSDESYIGMSHPVSGKYQTCYDAIVLYKAGR